MVFCRATLGVYRRKLILLAFLSVILYILATQSAIKLLSPHSAEKRQLQACLREYMDTLQPYAFLNNQTIILDNLTQIGLSIVNLTRPKVMLTTDHANSKLTQEANLTSDKDANLTMAYTNNWVGFPDLRNINCTAMLTFRGNNSQYPQGVNRVQDQQLLNISADCSEFIHRFGFQRYPTATQEEKDFPLAFIIVFHTSLDQVLFLLRAIYHPHNVYCLHPDRKVNALMLGAVLSAARCLPNVFVAGRLEDVVYAGFSRLMADINCMSDLMGHPVQWRYVINMPGQQFPLRTNLEMVRVLKSFNGSNDIEGLHSDKALLKHRYIYRHVVNTNAKTGEKAMARTGATNPSPPHKLPVTKGSAYGSFTRGFVQFVLNDPVAKDLLEWSRDLLSPDEYFWATLNYNDVIDVPGGTKNTSTSRKWMTSSSLWRGDNKVICYSKFLHDVCIYTPEDLPALVSRDFLFANKLHIDHHPAALHCLDEMVVNLTHSRLVRNFGSR
ncbi:N-acetyllactosaminide beta-1,6-N-acetylglucosaminyl-transferase-like [Physella acuta]|uniref:N-acetyllactosaminide beta-1,6-N-acetylglucosaminyl-transferase-like n=1 Tax=Physella acuta TaxID=109671 RepID=UPI0027DAD83E|nr:N-acetyllactosaminide beta-1,6-N-acetylglucosaminyl-transferase-like [Physella acuta]